MHRLYYIPWTVGKFTEYNTHVVKILSDILPAISLGEESSFYMALSPKYRIPPEVIEFLNVRSFAKINANIIRIGIRVPVLTDNSFIDWFNRVCTNNGILHINFLDWVLFMTEHRTSILGYYYVNCNPESFCYGKIMIILEKGVGTTPTIIVKYGSIIDLIADLTCWFNHYETTSINNVVIAINLLSMECPLYWQPDEHEKFGMRVTNQQVLMHIPNTDSQRHTIDNLHNVVTTLLAAGYCVDITTTSFTKYILC